MRFLELNTRHYTLIHMTASTDELCLTYVRDDLCAR